MQYLQTVHITMVLTFICCTVAKLITLHTYSCKGIQNFSYTCQYKKIQQTKTIELNHIHIR